MRFIHRSMRFTCTDTLTNGRYWIWAHFRCSCERPAPVEHHLHCEAASTGLEVRGSALFRKIVKLEKNTKKLFMRYEHGLLLNLNYCRCTIQLQWFLCPNQRSSVRQGNLQ